MEEWNRLAFDAIFSFAGHGHLRDAVGVFFASYLAYFLAGGLLLFAIFENGRRRALFVLESLLSLVLARGIITETIRFFYFSPRPFDSLQLEPLISQSGTSFPSGHTIAFFALGVTLFFYNKKWGAAYIGLSLLMGIFRIYAGVHWPFDIAGGAVLGIGASFFVHGLVGPYRSAVERPKPSILAEPYPGKNDAGGKKAV